MVKCCQVRNYTVVAMSRQAIFGVLFLRQVLLAVALLLTIYAAQLNCTNPCAGPECKIFTREVNVREQKSLWQSGLWSGSCRKNMAVLKLIGL